MGYFYASQDADTEGVEGKYYVWGIKEVLEMLGPKHGKVAARAFGITSAGNFEGKGNVLTNADSMEKISEEEGHHPDISFGWGYAKIIITTHAIEGLSENDFILAAKIDQIFNA